MDRRRATGPIRCAFCHADLDEPSLSCRRCGTALHPDCGAALPACPTLGCAEVQDKVRAGPPPHRLGFLVQVLVVLLPALPFAVIVVPFYYYCSDHLVTGFHMMASWWPFEGLLLLVGIIAPIALLNGWR